MAPIFLFSAIRLTEFPLFPSDSARSDSIPHQKRGKEMLFPLTAMYDGALLQRQGIRKSYRRKNARAPHSCRRRSTMECLASAWLLRTGIKLPSAAKTGIAASTGQRVKR